MDSTQSIQDRLTSEFFSQNARYSVVPEQAADKPEKEPLRSKRDLCGIGPTTIDQQPVDPGILNSYQPVELPAGTSR